MWRGVAGAGYATAVFLFSCLTIPASTELFPQNYEQLQSITWLFINFLPCCHSRVCMDVCSSLQELCRECNLRTTTDLYWFSFNAPAPRSPALNREAPFAFTGRSSPDPLLRAGVLPATLQHRRASWSSAKYLHDIERSCSEYGIIAGRRPHIITYLYTHEGELCTKMTIMF